MNANPLDSDLVSKLIFFPQALPESMSAAISRQQNSTNTCTSLAIRTHDNTFIHCVYFKSVDSDTQKRNTLVHFHGNGESTYNELISAHTRSVFQQPSIALDILLVEYRGYGDQYAAGRPPRLYSAIRDVEYLCRYITESLCIPQERIVVFGRSLGSIFAIEFASICPRIAALIIDSGLNRLSHLAIDLAGKKAAWEQLQRFYPPETTTSNESAASSSAAEELENERIRIKELFRRTMDDQINNESKLAALQTNVLLLHTANDNITSIECGRDLFHWSCRDVFETTRERAAIHEVIENENKTVTMTTSIGSSGESANKIEKTIVEFAKGGHNFILAYNYDSYCAAVQQFLLRIRSATEK